MMVADRIGAVLLGLSVWWLIVVWVERRWARFDSRWSWGILLLGVNATVATIAAASVGGYDSDAWAWGAGTILIVFAVGAMFWGSRRAGLGIAGGYPDWGSVRAVSWPLALGGLLFVWLPGDVAGHAWLTVVAVVVPPLMAGVLWFFVASRRPHFAEPDVATSVRKLVGAWVVSIMVLGWLFVDLGAAWWTLGVAIGISLVVVTVSEFEQSRVLGGRATPSEVSASTKPDS